MFVRKASLFLTLVLILGGFFSSGCALMREGSKELALSAAEAAAEYVAKNRDEWKKEVQEYVLRKTDEAKEAAIKRLEKEAKRIEKKAEEGNVMAQIALAIMSAFGLGGAGVKLYKSGRKS